MSVTHYLHDVGHPRVSIEAPRPPDIIVPPPVWTTIFDHSPIATDNAGWNGYNARIVINSSLLTTTGTTSQVRVTFQASTLASIHGGFTLDGAEIGQQAPSGNLYNFDGGQVPLLFSGSPGVVVPAVNGATIVSDPANFTVSGTKNLIIAVHFSATSTMSQQTGSVVGTRTYYKFAANEVSVSNVSGYIGEPADILFLVSKIEVK